MVRGVNKFIIEVNDPESKYFEKVIFFVKSEYDDVNSKKLQNEGMKITKSAEKNIGNANISHERFKFKKSRKGLFWTAGILLCVISFAIVLTVLS